MGTGDRLGYVLIDNALINRGDLILVNETRPLAQGYSLFRSVNIFNESRNALTFPVAVNTTDLMIERRVLSAFVGMLRAAYEAEEYTFFVNRAFSMNDETPDFRTGLSLNMAILPHVGGSFNQHPQGRWILSNAHLYGFVQRFTRAKEEITGHANNYNHFRYVGFPHAYIMNEKSLSLEEYVDFIRRTERITVNNNDRLAYEIIYQFANPGAEDSRTAIRLSEAAFEAYNQGRARITVSGDNFAGFIVTVIYEVH